MWIQRKQPQGQKNNTYNIDPWQRVSSFEDLKDKMLQLRDNSFLELKLTEFRSNYKKVLLTEKQYFSEFNSMMNLSLDKSL